MPRQPISPSERALNQLWAVALQCHLGMDVRDLDTQLPFESEDDEPFVPHVSPAPFPRRLSPRMFQQAYRDGRNPNHCQWRDPITDAPFNLAERVDRYVPGASDWLLQGVRGYMPGREIPSLSSCRRQREACLSRLQLTQWPTELGFLALRACPRDALAIERMWCRSLGDTGHPIVLLLLVSLLHERQCCYPGTPAVDRLREAALHAAAHFLARDELNFCDTAKKVRDAIAAPLMHGIERVGNFNGSRGSVEVYESAPPSPVLVFGPVPESLSRCGRSTARSTWRRRDAYDPEWQLYEETQHLYLEEGDSWVQLAIDGAERAFQAAFPRMRALSQVRPG